MPLRWRSAGQGSKFQLGCAGALSNVLSNLNYAANGGDVTDISRMLGVSLGEMLSVPLYDCFGERVNKVIKLRREPWNLFTLGWTGFGYRSRAADEHYCAYRGTFPTGRNQSHEEHYQADQHWVDFVANCAAAAETMLFAISILANFAEPGTFPDDTESGLRRSREDIAKRIATAFPATPLAEAVSVHFTAASDGQALFEVRDVVLHRGRLPRLLSLGGSKHGQTAVPVNPKALPGDWLYDRVLDINSLAAWRSWFCSMAPQVIHGATALLITVENRLEAT